MAKITIADTSVLVEPRRIRLGDMNSGRTVRIDNPDGQVSFYIINKIPSFENLNRKPNTVALTNLGSGRLVQKHSSMSVIPISVDALINVFPKTKGNE